MALGQMITGVEMNVGNYIVGFFQGVVSDGEYLRFQVSDDPGGEGFVQRLSFRPVREDGSETVPGVDLIQKGDRVLVRVFEEAKMYMKDGDRKAFVARRVLACEVLNEDV